MQKNNLSTFTLSIVIVTIIVTIIPYLAFAIGQMTKPIEIENVLRGQEVTEILYLVNSEDEEVTYQLTADGQIADWASFYKIEDENLENPITEILLPSKSNLQTRVKFKVPEDTPNDTYTGQVAILTLPGEAGKEGMSVSVGLRVGRDVSITITDKEIIDFQTTIIPLKYGLGRGEPLKIKIIYDNQGNVSIKPDLHLKIIQISTGNTVHNAIYPYPEGEKAVRPFERKVFEELLSWSSAAQPNGKYKAEIKVLLNSKSYKEESFRFDIGVDIWALLLASIAKFFGRNLTLVWFVLGGFFAVLAGILTILYKRPKLLKAGINKSSTFFQNIKSQSTKVLDKIKSIF